MGSTIFEYQTDRRHGCGEDTPGDVRQAGGGDRAEGRITQGSILVAAATAVAAAATTAAAAAGASADGATDTPG